MRGQDVALASEQCLDGFFLSLLRSLYKIPLIVEGRASDWRSRYFLVLEFGTSEAGRFESSNVSIINRYKLTNVGLTF